MNGQRGSEEDPRFSQFRPELENRVMFRIRATDWIAPRIRRLVVEAPRIARRHQPGHFVILRVFPGGERIPLTIADSTPEQGTITLIVQAVGATTERLCALAAEDFITDVVGPLGRPTEIENFGHVAVVGGGVGAAVIYPQALALKRAGNRVTAIVGARSQAYVILEAELGKICDQVLVCTDDGSYGFRGFVTRRLAALLDEKPALNAVLTAGPVPMMRAVADTTRGSQTLTVASLNPVMVDGTGMCGGCRVRVGGKMLFACVDGPEFNAHQVDFGELVGRLDAYHENERSSALRLGSDPDHLCRLARAEVTLASRSDLTGSVTP